MVQVNAQELKSFLIKEGFKHYNTFRDLSGMIQTTFIKNSGENSVQFNQKEDMAFNIQFDDVYQKERFLNTIM